jgi:hypothetical protein
MGTPPTFPPDNNSGGSWGSDLPDYGSDELQFPDRRLPQPSKPGEPHISKMPWPPKTYDVEGNLLPNPPLSSTRIEHAIVRPPRPREPEISLADAFVLPWQNDTEQQDWLKRWDIQPANDARYLPTFPEPNDTTTGADIRRDWHNSYKDFAKNTIGQYAPMFAEQMPQPQPQQSYGDFMGEVKNTASTLVNSAASQLGGGLGSALSFIPGLGPIMELIGQGANIGSTVAGATGLGGEKAGTILNLVGNIANGAAGGASAAGAEEFGPAIPSEGGMFSGLRPNQPPSATALGTPPFKPQPAPAASDGEGSWFKPLDQMFQEIDERQARGETFDEKNNVWVKPATATGSASIPQEKRFGQVAEDSELNLPKPPYPAWPKDQMPASPFDPNRPPSPTPQPEPEQYGPEMPEATANKSPSKIPYNPHRVMPTPADTTLLGATDAIGPLMQGPAADKVLGKILDAKELGKNLDRAGDESYKEIYGGAGKSIYSDTSKAEHKNILNEVDNQIKAHTDAGNAEDVEIWRRFKELTIKERENMEKGVGINILQRLHNDEIRRKLLGQLKNGISTDAPEQRK